MNRYEKANHFYDLGLLLFSGIAKGQQGAIKTNLLHLSFATLNAALEMGTGRESFYYRYLQMA